MKILKLKINNIASIEDAEIDFSNGPLASDPIFLISGDTGTGKSTILNAICLALYNKVPMLETIGIKEEDREGLQTNNTRQLMRKGSVTASVQLTFVGNDDKRYIVNWETGRAYGKISGKIKNIERSILDVESHTSYTRKDEIDAMVLRVVGLTFDQFTRTTMLAQGQFTSFMKAKEDEKSDILEKLTGTEIYARIGQKVNQLFKAKETEYKLLEAQIKAARLLPESQKEEYRQRIAQLKVLLVEAEGNFKHLETKLNWLKQTVDLQQQLQAKETVKNQAEATIASEAYTSRRDIVTKWDETADIRRLLTEEKEAISHIESINKKLYFLSTDRWHSILDGVKWMESELGKVTQRIESERASLAMLAPYASIFANTTRLDEMAKNVDRATKQAKAYTIEYERIKNEAQRLSEMETPLAAAVLRAKSDCEAKEALVKDAEAEAAKFDLNSISSTLKEIDEHIAAVQSAIEAIERYRQYTTRREEAEKELKAATDERTMIEKRCREATSHMAEATDRYTRCQSYAQGQMELKDHIMQLRQKFAETHSCPLCGTKGVHLHADSEIDQKVAEAQAQADEAKKALDALTTQISKSNAALKIWTEEENKRRIEFDKASIELESARALAEKLSEGYMDDDIVTSLLQSKEKLAEKRILITEQLKSADNAQRALVKARKDLDHSREALKKAEKDHQAHTQKTQQLFDSAKLKKELADNAASSASSTFDQALALLKIGEGKEKAMIDWILSETRLDEITIESLRIVSDQIRSKAEVYEGLKASIDNLQHNADNMSRTICDYRSNIADLSKKFASHYEATAIRRPSLAEDIRSINTEANNLEGALRAEEEKQHRLELDIIELLNLSPLSREDIEAINKTNITAIDNYRKALKSADDALTTALSQMAVIAEQLERHMANRPDIGDASIDSLSVAKGNADQLRKTYTAEISQYQTLLDNDEANAKKNAQDITRLETLRKERNDWEILDKNFGTADGSRFKRIAQSYLLRVLLHKANYYLRMLTNRFLLDCEDGSLTINVIDELQGGTLRNVGLLSGGESFVVSLALALGLSAISKEKIHVDILFIDEGFGTLDKDYLSTVIDTLDNLHRIGGRRIGIISHVAELKERIPTQILVTSKGNNCSKIEVKTI